MKFIGEFVYKQVNLLDRSSMMNFEVLTRQILGNFNKI
jgi:hypothetical protein